MDHDHDVPGAGPIRILALEEGDEHELPHEVEAELRRPMEKKPPVSTRPELLQQFRDDFETSTYDRPGCLHDWQKVHPELAIDFEGIKQEVEYGPKPLPKVPEPVLAATPVHAADPEEDEVGDPTPGAIGVLAFVAVCVSLLLAVCRICGADVSIVWILAPLWGSALALSLAGAVVTTIAWAERNG